MTDLSHAIRLVRRQAVFTAIAVVTLAIGIGANTAVFNLAYALMDRSLPVPEPQRLVRYRLTADHAVPGLDLPATYMRDFGLSGPMFDLLRARLSRVNDVFAWTRAEGLTVVRDGQRYAVRAAWASGATFRALKLQAAAGRLLDERDDRAGATEWTAVVSYRYWVQTWNRDPAVVGRSIVVEDTPVTIVGVVPDGFTGVLTGDDPQIVLPLELEPVIRSDDSLRLEPGALTFTAIGRLQPLATFAEAVAEVRALAPAFIVDTVPPAIRDETIAALRLDAVSGRSGWSTYRIEYERPLRQFQWFTAIVLLVISANLGGLLLARGASRVGEFSMRGALGASRRRLLRQLLVEQLVLAAMAIPLGCAIAIGLDRTAIAFFGSSSFATGGPLLLDLRPGAVVVGVAIVSGVAAILFAAAIPALVATSRASLPGARAPSRRPRAIGRYLIPMQVGLSLVLITVALSAAASIVRLLSTPVGMHPEGVMMAVPDLRGRGEQGADRLALFERIVEAIRRMPGVDSVAMARELPMSGAWNNADYARDVNGALREDRHIVQNVIGPEFFRTLGIRMIQGRDFDAHDRRGSPDVCVLNQSAAAYFFPGQPAIGGHIDRRSSGTRRPLRCEVVAVVADTKFWTLSQEPPRTIYRPFAQEAPERLALVAKGAPALTSAAFRNVFAEILPAGTVVTPTSLAEQTLASVLLQRGLAWIAGSLGVLALLLTCVSLYGQVAWNVARRTTEFGVRLALGGTSNGLIRLVIGGLIKPFAFGALGGLVVLSFLSQFAAAFLYRTTVVDASLLAAALVALGLACVAASYLPARSAARVEPASALRGE